MLIGICSITPNTYGDDKYGIGKDEDLLYHNKKDLKWFKDTTSGGTVIMGSTTEKQTGFLQNRENIVLTHKIGNIISTPNKIYTDIDGLIYILANPKRYNNPSVFTVKDFENYFASYVIGGSKIFDELNSDILLFKVNQFHEKPDSKPNKFVDLSNYSIYEVLQYEQDFQTKVLVNKSTINTFWKLIFHDLEIENNDLLIDMRNDNIKTIEFFDGKLSVPRRDICVRETCDIQELYHIISQTIFAYYMYIINVVDPQFENSTRIKCDLINYFSKLLSKTLSGYQNIYDRLLNK